MKTFFILLICVAGGLSQLCGPDEFVCDAGGCIPLCWVCDGDNDCGDFSDERPDYCIIDGCRDHEFECDNGRCVCQTWFCDGDSDCGDGSDERDCPCPDEENYVKCESGECIRKEFHCDSDGICDCPDCTDQGDHCMNTTVHAHTELSPLRIQMDRLYRKKIGKYPAKRY